MRKESSAKEAGLSDEKFCLRLTTWRSTRRWLTARKNRCWPTQLAINEGDAALDEYDRLSTVPASQACEDWARTAAMLVVSEAGDRACRVRIIWDGLEGLYQNLGAQVMAARRETHLKEASQPQGFSVTKLAPQLNERPMPKDAPTGNALNVAWYLQPGIFARWGAEIGLLAAGIAVPMACLSVFPGITGWVAWASGDGSGSLDAQVETTAVANCLPDAGAEIVLGQLRRGRLRPRAQPVR